VFLISDLDRNVRQDRTEELTLILDELDSYTLTPGEAADGVAITPRTGVFHITATTDEADNTINFQPTDENSNMGVLDPGNAIAITFSQTSEFTVTYRRSTAGIFDHSGDFLPTFFTSPVTTDINTEFAATFTKGELPVAVTAEDITVIDDGLITGATINLANPQTDDRLNPPAAKELPEGIAVRKSKVATRSTVQLIGNASTEAYATAIRAVKFENTSETPNVQLIREIQISVLDDEALSSNIAKTSINVVAPGVDTVIDTDADGIPDDVDLDDDGDGILDSLEGFGLVESNFTHPSFKTYDPDGTLGLATAARRGKVVVDDGAKENASGTDIPLDVGDVYVYSMNDGEDLVAISIIDVSPSSTFNLELKGPGVSPKIEFEGVGEYGSEEERLQLDVTFYDPTDEAFSGLDLGGVATAIKRGLGTPVPSTTSINIGDLDDDPVRRREGAGVSIDSTVSYTVEQKGTLSPEIEGDYIRARGTVIDPDDRLQFNFLLSEKVSLELLNDAESNAGYGLGFKTTSFETAVTVAEQGVDWDNDGLVNHQDLDSDNDGITDNVEAQLTAAYIAPSGIDANRDGLDDAYDNRGSDAANGPASPADVLLAPDTDNDASPDYLDTDSDGDDSSDAEEAGHNQGIQTGTSSEKTDFDGDGLFDAVEGSDINDGFDVNDENIVDENTINLIDSDGDASLLVPLDHDYDFRDATVHPDSDADGIIDVLDLDSDNDGVLDSQELSGKNPDIDDDGIPNHLDLDSDNDGLSDLLESGQEFTLVDTNNDGVLDDMQGKGVNDGNSETAPNGLSDGIESEQGAGIGIDPVDSDEDGVSDYHDTDSDNDGIRRFRR